MKIKLVGMLAILLMGCSASPDMYSSNSSDWHTYGYEQGMNGLGKTSFEGTSVSSDSIAAYSEGYQVGRNEYCEKAPYQFGKSHRPYGALCDY